MATRSIIRFAKREDGVSFSEHPDSFDAQFYAHWDGYPEHRGVEIAESILNSAKIAEDLKCIFVGKPQKLLDKYKLNTNNDR